MAPSICQRYKDTDLAGVGPIGTVEGRTIPPKPPLMRDKTNPFTGGWACAGGI